MLSPKTPPGAFHYTHLGARSEAVIGEFGEGLAGNGK
jgi:hypothetical protein